ncbi:Holliday junction ATP-dependent DNA helicase RuvA [Phycisphaerae bacterium RAS1]|nr:Holliday junction ATP-dependent DNA helicase RuvA [Phycisphaerae bacterium RAS1]
MITRITGRIVNVTDQAAILEAGPMCYEVLVPAAALGPLAKLKGADAVLHTLYTLEGNPATGQLAPRLMGFLSETDRSFFYELTKVKGISNRRALRVMCVPSHQIAAAIEHGDDKTLTSLPEVGKKSAAQMITELRGRMQPFLAPSAAVLPVSELTDAQRVAVDILVSWGDRRADAQHWIAEAVKADPALKEPDAMVKAAYRVKQGA